MDKNLDYELEILYTPTDRSDVQIFELGRYYNASVRNRVMPRNVEHAGDRKQIEEAMQRQGEKSGFPMGVVRFQPLKYETLCALVQSSLDVLEVISMSPRALK